MILNLLIGYALAASCTFPAVRISKFKEIPKENFKENFRKSRKIQRKYEKCGGNYLIISLLFLLVSSLRWLNLSVHHLWWY